MLQLFNIQLFITSSKHNLAQVFFTFSPLLVLLRMSEESWTFTYSTTELFKNTNIKTAYKPNYTLKTVNNNKPIASSLNYIKINHRIAWILVILSHTILSWNYGISATKDLCILLSTGWRQCLKLYYNGVL